MIVDALRSAAGVLLTAGCSAAALLARSLGSGEEGASRIMCWWGRAFIRTGGWEVRVEGIERLPPEGAVLVSNHQSLVDIPLLLFAFRRPVRFLAKRELGGIFLLGKAMAAAGNLFVDRNDPKDAVRAIRDASARVSAGELILIFPEGRRTLNGTIGEFKPGAFHLARITGAPVVPVYVGGGFEALPRGGRRFRAATLVVRVLAPLLAGEREGKSKEEIASSVRERILSAGGGTQREEERR